MPTLLIVHHTPSPPLHSMLESVVSGAGNDQLSGVEVKVRPALTASPVDVLGADGYILGTPVNLGYMSGALKHFFDQIYYPCLDATAGRPYGLYVHGNTDAAGAVRAVEVIATGLKWRPAHAPLVVLGQPSRAELEASWELGATVAAGLTLNGA